MKSINLKCWLNNNMSIWLIAWLKILSPLNWDPKLWKLLLIQRQTLSMMRPKSREELSKIESKLKPRFKWLWTKLIKIRKRELKELDHFKSQLKIRKRLLREGWKESGDNRKSLIWLPMRIKIKMKSKCIKSSSFRDFSHLSWRKRWKKRWTGTLLLKMLSKISELPQDFLMWMKSSIDSWPENKHIQSF